MQEKAQDMEHISRELSEEDDLSDDLDKAWREWEKTFDATKDSIMIVDGQFRIIQANLSTSHFLGKPLEEIIGKTCWQVVHGTESPPKECPLNKSIHSKKHEQTELYLSDIDTWVEVSVDPILDNNRNIEKMVHILRDITHRKKSEQALRYNEQRFKDIALNIVDVIWETDEKMVFTYCSDGMQKILGYPPAQVIGKKYSDFMRPEQADQINPIIKDILENKKIIKDIEGYYIHRDGSERCLITNGVPIYNESGVLTGYRGVCKDITRHKKAEQAILKEKNIAQKYLDVADVILVAVDCENRVGMINKKGCEILGYKEEEIIGKNWINNFMPERKKEEISAILNNLRAQKPETRKLCENPVLTKDNRERLIAWHNTVLKDENGIVYATISSGEDITDKKRAELALKDSEERYRDIFESTLIGLYRTTPDGRILMANDAIIRMLGYGSFEELAQRNLESGGFEPEYPRSEFKKQIEDKGQVVGLESAWLRHDGTTLFVRESARAIRDSAGNILFYQGTVENITDRKKAETALKESEEHYRMLAESMSDGLTHVDENGIKLYVNKKAADIFGCTPEQMTGHHWSEFYDPQARKIVEKEISLRKKGTIRPYELQNTTKDGRRIYLRISPQPIYDKDGQYKGSIIIITDITDRKKAEEALRREHNLLRLLIDNIPDRIYVKDNQHRFLIGNKTVLRCEGFQNEEELIGKTDFDLYPKELARSYYDEEREVIQKRQPLINREGPCLDKEGNKQWSLVTKVPLQDENGNSIGIVGINRDITEHKRAEQALADEAIRRHILIDQSRDGIVILDENGKVYEANQRFIEMLGYTPEKTSRLYVWDWDAQWSREQLLDMIRSVDASGDHFETCHRRKDGTIINVEISSNAAVCAGRKLIFCVCRDITERKEAERALQESEERFRNIFEGVREGLIYLDIAGRILDVNPRAIEMFAGSKEELIGKHFTKIGIFSFKDIPALLKSFAKAITGQKKSMEVTITNRRGQELTLESSTAIVKEKGHRNGIVIIVHDITERKKAEEALRREHNLLRLLIDNIPDEIYVKDTDSRMLLCNRTVAEHQGFSSPSELIGKTDFDLYPAKQAEKYRAEEQQIISSGEPKANYLEMCTSKRGGEIWGLNSKIPLQDNNGKIIGIVGIGRNITDLKRAEEMLWESENKFRELASSITDVFFAMDADLRYTYWNKATEKLTGIKAEDAIGKSIFEIFPDTEDIRKAASAFRDVLNQKQPKSFETVHSNQDKCYFFEVNAYPNEDGISVIAKDITERKRAEEALREAEVRYRTVADFTHDWEDWENPDGTFRYVSPSCERITGYAAENFIDNPNLLTQLILIEDQEIWTQHRRDTSQTPGLYEVQFRIQRSDSEIRWIERVCQPVTDQHGVFLGYRGSNRDITERKKAQKELQRLAEFWESIVQNANVYMDVLDENKNILIWNKAAEKISGYSADEVVGHDKIWLWQYPDPEYRQKIFKNAQEIINGQTVEDFETEIITKRGEKRTISWYSRNLTDENGKSIGSVATGIDITERRKAVEDLKQYKQIVSHTPDGIALLDKDYRYRIVNESYETFSGIKHEQFIGLTVAEYLGEQVFEELIRPNFDKCLRGEIVNYQAWFDYPVPGRRFIDVTYFPYRDADNRITGIVANARDITDRKLSEEALRQSEEKFYKAFHATSNLMGISTIKEGRIIDINDAYARLTGYSRDEIIGRTALELNLWVDWEQREEIIRKLQEEGKVYDFEVRIRTKAGDIITVLFSADIIILNNQPCMINMAIDITERKKAENALRKSEELYRTLAETMNDGLSRIDENGKFIYVNKKYGEMLGYTPHQMIGKHWTKFYDKEAQKIIEEQLTKRKKGITEPYEVTTKTKDKRQVYLRISPQVIFDKNKIYKGASSIVTDITERKDAERIIRESQKRLIEAQHIAKMGDFTWDLETGEVSWSDALYDLLHYDRSEKIDFAKVNADIHHPEDLERITRWLDDSISSDTTELTPNEYRLIRKDGKVIYVRTVGIIERRKNKQPKIFATVQDITKQKLAEQAIKANEIRFRELFNHMNSGVAIYSPCDNGKDFIFTDFNKAGERIDNVKKEDLIGRKATEIFPSIKEFGLFDVFQKVWKTGKPQYHPVSLYKDNRLTGWRENYVYKLPSGEIIAVYEDLTDHVKAQQALEQERYKLREYFENLPALAYNITFDGKIADCNQVTLNTLGYKNKDELIGKPVLTTLYPPSSRQRARELFDKWRKEGKLKNEEIQIITKHGEIIDVLLNVTTIFDHNDKPMHSLSTYTVITDRKKAEEALRERETLLNEVGTIAKIGGWEMDLITRKAKWTKGTYDIAEIEYDNAVPGPDEHIQYYLPEYRPIVEKVMRELIEDNKPMDFEAQFCTAKGNIKWCRAVGRAIRKGGKCIKVYGTFQDITDLKQIENIARDREEKLMSIVRAAPIAIGLLSNRVILQVNDKMCEMLGYTAEELIGQNSRVVYPDEQEYEYVGREQYSQINKHGAGTVETKWKRKNGQIIDVIQSCTPLDPSDLSRGLTFTALDNTQRKKAEKKLLKEQSRLKALASELTLTEERERRRLATELHDEIGQLLAVSKMKLDSVLKTGPNNKNKNQLNEICSMLDTAITETRTLTFDLSSSALYNLGFEAAVSEWLNEQIEKNYAIRTEFEDDGKPKPLDDDIRILLFRNIRELLLNVVKHADAKKVKVCIKNIDEQISVSVEDDGAGFEHEDKLQIPDKKGGFGLFSIRQRLEELGGGLEIESKPGEGTTVKMTAPLTKKM